MSAGTILQPLGKPGTRWTYPSGTKSTSDPESVKLRQSLWSVKKTRSHQWVWAHSLASPQMHGHTSIDWKRWYIFITYINFFLWWVHSSCPFRQEMQEIIASLSPTSPFPPQATSCRPLSRTEREWPYLPWEESERVGGLTPYRGSLLIKFWRTKNLGFIQIWEHRCPLPLPGKEGMGKGWIGHRVAGNISMLLASPIPPVTNSPAIRELYETMIITVPWVWSG